MITNNLLVLNYDESLSIEAKLKYLENTFNAVQPEILTAIENTKTLIPTIDGKVIELFQAWVTSGEFNDLMVTELQYLVSGFPAQVTSQSNALTLIQNTLAGNQTAYETQLTNANNLTPTVTQIQTIITAVTNVVSNLTNEYGSLYQTYQNLQTTYNTVTTNLTNHGTAVDTTSSQIGNLYGQLTALNNRAQSFSQALTFYPTFSENFLTTLTEFSTTVPQNTTDINNLTALLTNYQTPINNAISQLTDITNSYTSELQQWNALLELITSVNASIDNANIILDQVNSKLNVDQNNVTQNTNLITNLTTYSAGALDNTFTPVWLDVTSGSVFSQTGNSGTVGYWQIGVNKFILVIQGTFAGSINQGTLICSLPTPISDANWLPINQTQIFALSIRPNSATDPNVCLLSITPLGVVATSTWNAQTGGRQVNESIFFTLGTN